MKIALILILTLATVANGQHYTTLKTTGRSAAGAYNEGLKLATTGEYAIAQGYFEMAIKADPQLIDAHLALGEVRSEQGNYTGAGHAYEAAVALSADYSPLVFYKLGQLYWNLQQYDRSVEHLERYLSIGGITQKNKSAASKLLERARFASTAVKNPVPFNPIPLGDAVNSEADEYFPTLTADGETLIFTRNEAAFPGDENFYKTQWKKGIWEKAVPLQGVNTTDNEGAQAISPDGTWLVFTACNRQGDGAQGSCDLYWSQEKNGTWSKPVPFSSTINSPHWDSQPTISADGKSIIFSSRRPSGLGREDLWITRRLPNNKWTSPTNLGHPINTGGMEQTPFLHPDGQTLYFCSDSLPGMGGKDLYVTRLQPDTTWSLPQNLGYPINTPQDEVALSVSLDGKTAFFSSNRPGSRKIDIYSFELPPNARPKPVTYAKVIVREALSGQLLSAQLEFVNLNSGQSLVKVHTRQDGTALACLPSGSRYALQVKKERYLFHSEHFDLSDSSTFFQPFLLTVELSKIPDSTETAGNAPPVVLRNVFFTSGSAHLEPASVTELNSLSSLLQQNRWLKIQLNGHTDDVGSDADNLTLSEARARAVMAYLTAKGIEPQRLRAVGFGETKPLLSNETAGGRAKNRRTEFELW
jgi:outer membrane protein OmpA-like peptidoglycan-associated protein